MLSILIYVMVAFCSFKLGMMVAKSRFEQFFTFMVVEHIDDIIDLHNELVDDLCEE